MSLNYNNIDTPKHYRDERFSFETRDITRYLPCDLSNIWKYCMRHNMKNGEEDLGKACNYFDDFIKYQIDPMSNTVKDVKMCVPMHVFMMMEEVYEVEENPIIKDIFREVIDIAYEEGLVNPIQTNARLQALKDMVGYKS